MKRRFGRWILVCICLAAPLSATAAGYYAQNGRIHTPNEDVMQLRGIAHFGFGGPTLQPTYIWGMGWKEQLAQIKSLGFNAVRVPISPDTLYNRTPISQLGYFDPNRNPEFVGKYASQVLDIRLAEADRLGLYILLDMHSIPNDFAYPTWYLSNPATSGLVPHSYGPDVYMKKSFSAPDYPANLAPHWEILFGQFYAEHPVVIGEWGGKCGTGKTGQMDKVWQDAFVDYLVSKNMKNSFYWSCTPNSGDVGGILDDQLRVRQDGAAAKALENARTARRCTVAADFIEGGPVTGDGAWSHEHACDSGSAAHRALAVTRREGCAPVAELCSNEGAGRTPTR